ncbi:hypothetical protein ACFX13_037224 [Malus domestica]
MSAQQIAGHREGADIYHGEALCRQKFHELLDKMCLPRGLLPLDDVVEFGYNSTSGFVWLKQKKRKEHRFRAISKTVSYDTEVMGFLEEHRMRRLSGVKSKELLVWVSISDIYVDPNSDLNKITFANGSGISRSFPVTAFGLEGEEKNGFFNPKPWKSSHVRFLLLQWQATCSQSFAYNINPNPALHFLPPPVLDPSQTIPFSNMSSALIKTHRSNAETYHGEALCKQKFHELLKELSLPQRPHQGRHRGDGPPPAIRLREAEAEEDNAQV